jgi:hypothetical protein
MASTQNGVTSIVSYNGLRYRAWFQGGASACPLPPVKFVMTANGGTTGMNVTGPGSPAYGPTRNFTVRNDGFASALVTSSLTGDSAYGSAYFEFLSDTCNGATLAPGDSCSVSIRSKASGNGTLTGIWRLTETPYVQGFLETTLTGNASGFAANPAAAWYSGIAYSGIGAAYAGNCIAPTETLMNDELASNKTSYRSAAGDDAWIQADLGSARTVSKVRVGTWTACVVNGQNTGQNWSTSTVLQASQDGVNWETTVPLSTTASFGTMSNYSFSAVTARYWRLFNPMGNMNTSQFRLGN